MDLNEYREIFITEAQEHLEALNAAALRLEKGGDDTAALSELFRSAHTLKGMAATMGFDPITELSHHMEDVLDALRHGTLTRGPGLADLLFSCIDTLGGQIGALAQGGQPQDAPEALRGRLKQALEGTFAPAAAAPAPQPAAPAPQPAPDAAALAEAAMGQPVWRIRVLIDPSCTFKGVRGFMVVRNLEKMGKLLATRPDAKAIEAGTFQDGFELDLASLEQGESLRKACMKVMEVADADVVRLEAPRSGVDAPAAPAGPAPSTPAPVPAPAPAPAPAEAHQAAPRAAEAANAAKAPKQSVRVSVERLDNLMNLVGELVTHRIRLAQISKEKGNKELKDSLAQLERVINELQDEVMTARMVPMDHVFNRFPRMVRDLAHDLGKDVDLVIEGKDIELDRTVLEEVSDPLVHLLRNALDHGIEPPEERARLGKPAQGSLKLSAVREKNQVVIEVADDGAGISAEKIRQSAVAKGFVDADTARRMTDADAVALIFLPGFSTAKNVTAVSGRGVGLDAVKSRVEGFGGVLRLESQVGRGSRFMLRLPMTLAIIQALLARVGGEMYAVPVANTSEAIECAGTDLKQMQGSEVVLLRGQVLPVIRLGKLLDVPGYDAAATPDLFTVLVVEAADRRMGLMVDEIVGQQEIAIKSLGRFLKGVRGFGGVTVLGDGRIVLILDAPSLV